MNHIFDTIQTAANTPSKNEKDALLAAAASEDLRKVLGWAYNPLIVFGFGEKLIAELRAGVRGVGVGELGTSAFELLTKLSNGTLTGGAAIVAVEEELNGLTKESAELLIRILAKDLRAGFSEGTIERVFPGLLPVFPYMRCSLPAKSNMAKWDWSQGAVSQEKADGMFVNINHLSSGQVVLTSRQGTPMNADNLGVIPEIKAKLKAGTQTHGEAVVMMLEDGVWSVAPREIGNGILNSGELPQNCRVQLQVWDQIPQEAVKAKGKCDVPYVARLGDLIKQVMATGGVAGEPAPLVLIPTKVVHSKDQAMAHYRELLLKGKEGTILKIGSATWKDGTSKDQVKFKLEVDVDLECREVIPGKAGTKNEGRPGSLRCSTRDGNLVVDVTIKNEKMRDEVEESPQTFVSKIFAVRANDVMKPSESNDLHSLYLPRLVEASYRRDKFIADSLDEVLTQFANAVKG